MDNLEDQARNATRNPDSFQTRLRKIPRRDQLLQREKAAL
jgi:hypothetical protein